MDSTSLSKSPVDIRFELVLDKVYPIGVRCLHRGQANEIAADSNSSRVSRFDQTGDTSQEGRATRQRFDSPSHSRVSGASEQVASGARRC